MTKPLLPDIVEATRLTRAGRLSEATAVLKKLWRGHGQGTEEIPTVIDLNPTTVTVVDAKPVDERSRPHPILSAKDALAKALSAFSPERKHTTESTETETVPGRGTVLTGVFSNHAGQRSYKLYVPSERHTGPRPLVIMLHGCTQSPDDFAAGTRMNFAAEEHGCFVAYPEQTAAANSSKCWNWFESRHQARDQGEPSLIAGITQKIITEHNIDRRRVYIAGLSAGGAAAAVVAESYPELFAALGVHSGLAYGAASDLTSAFAAMQGRSTAATSPAAREPLPTIVFHGDRDSTVHPRNGSEVVGRATAGAVLQEHVEQGAIAGGRTYTRSVHRAADGREWVEEWVIHGAGHAWSGGSTAGSFTDPLGPDATREMLRFFLSRVSTNPT